MVSRIVCAPLLALVMAVVCSMQQTEPPADSIHLAALRGDTEVVQQHIEYGSDLNQQDSYGSTPLFIAVTFGHPAVADQLIKAGAEIETLDANGSTPLHAAAFFGRIEIVEMLLNAGANRFARNANGSTAYDIAVSPIEYDIPLYDSLNQALGSLGLKLDYEELRSARPKIAAILEPSAEEFAAVQYTPDANGNWPVTTPEAAGLDPVLLERLYLDASRMENLYGLLVAVDGELVAEGYFNGSGIEDQPLIQSATKSYISALVGIAHELGYLPDLDQPMIDYFPEFAGKLDDQRKYEITVRQLLQMRSGLPWEETDPDLWEIFAAGDHMPLLTDLELTCDPGTEFNYSNLSTYILGVIIERASGTELEEFAENQLFQPLGTKDVTWWTDSLGYCYPIIHVRARDAAWFGQLYLDDGEIHHRRLLSADYVHDSLATHSEEAWIAVPPQTHISRYLRELGYGYQWWSATVDGYRFDYAAGHGGQLIILLDEYRMVIVVTADPYFLIHDAQAWKHEQACFNLVGRFIKELLRETGKPPNDK